MEIPLSGVWGCLSGLTSHRRHSAAISPACHGRDLGLFLAFHVEPHGDGNQRVFITVPEGRATIPCRAYRVPSCMPSSIQRSLSGPSIDRSRHLAASSGYLQLLGFQAIAHARKAGCGHARVPLLTRKGLMSLGRIDLWGVTARSRQLHTDKVLHGTIKTAVASRQRYKGLQ